MTTARLLRSYARQKRTPSNLVLGLLKKLPPVAWRLQVDHDPNRPGADTEVLVRDSTNTHFRVRPLAHSTFGYVREVQDLTAELADLRDYLVTRGCDAADDLESLHWQRQVAALDEFVTMTEDAQ